MKSSVFDGRIFPYFSNPAFVNFEILRKLFEVNRLTCIENVFYDSSVLAQEITLLFKRFKATAQLLDF